MTFFCYFQTKKFFLTIFSFQKNYFKNFFRFIRKVENPSVLRKNFFAPNYNTVYQHKLSLMQLMFTIVKEDLLFLILKKLKYSYYVSFQGLRVSSDPVSLDSIDSSLPHPSTHCILYILCCSPQLVYYYYYASLSNGTKLNHR